MQPFVSVVVPAYNAERWLGQCVESVLAQEGCAWEMLIVDDGSRDGTGALADAYAGRDGRVRVIHQSNAGASVARNTGIAAARGHYLFFLDADDYLLPVALAALAEAARRHAMPQYVKGNHRVLMADGSEVTTKFAPPRQVFDNQEINAFSFLEFLALPHPVVWNALIERRFLVEKGIAFTPDAWPREDLIFHLDMLGHTFSGTYTQTETMVYRLAVAGSLSNSVTRRSAANLSVILPRITAALGRCETPGLVAAVERERTNTVGVLLSLLPRVDAALRRQLLQTLADEPQLPTLSGSALPVRLLRRAYGLSPALCRALAAIMAMIVPPSKRITR